jgi:hypothetical protein
MDCHAHTTHAGPDSTESRNKNNQPVSDLEGCFSKRYCHHTSSLSSYTVSITNNLAGLEDLDNHLSFLVFFSFMDTAISAFKPQQPWSEDRTPNGFSLLTGLPVDIAFFQLNWKGLEPDNSTQWTWSRTPLMDFFSLANLGFLLFLAHGHPDGYITGYTRPTMTAMYLVSISWTLSIHARIDACLN